MEIKKINKQRSIINKSLSVLITSVILLVLVLSGPAQAVSLNLGVDGSSEVEQGKKITFLATLDLTKQDQNLPIDSLTLKLDELNGDGEVSCTFDITGKKTEAKECHSFNIKKIPKPKIDYGYGYGYGDFNSFGYGYKNYSYGYGYSGEKVLTYEITFHTQGHKPGEYTTSLSVNVKGDSYQTDGTSIKIIEKENGKDEVNEQENGKDEVNEQENGKDKNEISHDNGKGNDVNTEEEDEEDNSPGNSNQVNENNKDKEKEKENQGNKNPIVNNNVNSGDKEKKNENSQNNVNKGNSQDSNSINGSDSGKGNSQGSNSGSSSNSNGKKK